MTPAFNCPYCKKPVEVHLERDHDFSEDAKTEMECPHCEKNFVFDTTVTITHDAFKADCLNGNPHKYKETRTIPRRYARMRCDDCNHESPLSPERLAEIISQETP